MSDSKKQLGNSNSSSNMHSNTTIGEDIQNTDVVLELENSFLEYSMSVIVARALPDVRDGLKPVHRRVLYSLYEQGIRPGTPHKKCARVVGDVMGKYHPHGDSSIYEALVRMAQPWSMQLMLVDGHGNFGSPDDGPAAMRYTECRMSPSSFSMVDELSEDTVALIANYDQTEREPEVLPSRIPNLLINGSTGIAVGMATNMPPHNLIEIVSALKAMLVKPNIDLESIMRYIPAPDFPTGGLLIGIEGIRESFASGRGQFRIRAKTHIEDISPRRKGIVVTELPYNVGPEKVISKIKELSINKRLLGIADIKDLSDRKTGLRLVIECKSGFSPSNILDDLFRLTPLEESFSTNNVCLVNGEPRTLGILDLCREYIKHRVDVVRKRTIFRKSKAESREHIVEGLVLALESIDQIVALIKSSTDSDSARNSLMVKYSLSEIQANAILEMTLRRLTSLEVSKLKNELIELKSSILELTSLLDSSKLMNDLVSKELSDVASSFGVPRRSILLSQDSSDIQTAEQETSEPCIISVSTTEFISKSYPVSQSKNNKNRVIKYQLLCMSNDEVGLITSDGKLHRTHISNIPSSEVRSGGLPAKDIFNLSSSQKIVGLITLKGITTLITKNGFIKKIEASNIPQRSASTIITLKDEDIVVAGIDVPHNASDAIDYLIISSHGKLLRMPAKSVRPQGCAAGGVTGIKLQREDYVIGFGSTYNEKSVLVTVTNSNAVKMSDLLLYPTQGRGGAGVRCHTFKKNDSSLKLAWIGNTPILAIDGEGNTNQLTLELSRRDGSGNIINEDIVSIGTTKLTF